MYQASDQTRLFFNQTPGEKSEYRIIVKLSSGKCTILEDGTIWYCNTRGEKFLIGYADTTSYESLWDNGSYKEKLDTIPISDIRSLSINKDATVITRSEASYEAKSGMWEIIPTGDTTWTWHAYDATKYYTKDNEDFRVQVNASVPETDIHEMDISHEDAGLKFLFISVGIPLIIGIVFVVISYVTYPR